MSELKFQDPKKKFCEELCAAREAKGLDLSRVAEKSKITFEYLEKMESGDWSFLPHAYVRAFLRTYAQIVGLDVTDVLTQFDRIVDEPAIPIRTEPTPQDHEGQKETKQRKDTGTKDEEEKKPLTFTLESESDYKERETFKGGRLWWLAAIAFVAIFLVVVLWPRGAKREAVEEIPFEEVVEAHEELVASTKDTSRQEIPKEAVNSEKKQLQLMAEVTDSCYLRVVADADTFTIDHRILQPGENKTYEADSLLYIVVGNAGGIRLFIDGRDLGLLGQTGQVITLWIGEEGIIRSQRGAPQPPQTDAAPSDTTVLSPSEETDRADSL